MGTNHVELRNVTKRFGEQRTVNQIGLVLKTGESMGPAEHNGAGKSTIIKPILGLITPNEGEIIFLGKCTGSKAGAQVRAQIGYLPGTVALHPSLTDTGTMAFYAKLKKQPLAKNRELLGHVGILQAVDRRVGTYSRGIHQRLALAQALPGGPKVLLFDESITGLNSASRQMFCEVMRELSGKSTTVLLSTRALAELDDHADRIVVMRNGVKVADGDMDELHIQNRLPFIIIVRLKGRVPLSERWQRSDGLLYCAQYKTEERMALLGKLGDLSRLNHIDIHTPTLDDMYAQLLKKEGV